MVGDRLVGFVLRLSGPLFQRAWSGEVHDTYRSGCTAVKQSRGRIGLFLHVISELLDLIKAAWRSRFGSPLPITGGVTPRDPNEPRPTMRPFIDDVRNSFRRLIRQPRAVTGTILLLAL